MRKRLPLRPTRSCEKKIEAGQSAADVDDALDEQLARRRHLDVGGQHVISVDFLQHFIRLFAGYVVQ